MHVSSISAFLTQHYDVLYKGEQVNQEISNAEIFLLSETHGNPIHLKVNNLFINTFAGHNDCVLIEGFPSMRQIESKDAAMSVGLDIPAKIFGWDYGTTTEMFGESLGRNDLVPLQIEKAQIFSKIGSIQNPNEKEALKVRFKEISGILQKEMIKSMFSGLVVQPSLHFEQRTCAMTTSLSHCIALQPEKIFLLAGEAHLNLESAKFFGMEKAISQFYEFISTQRAVILTPKIEEGALIAREEIALVKETQIALTSEMFLQLMDDDSRN